MILSRYIDSLQKKHNKLQNQLDSETTSSADDLYIANLKRKKLLLKDKIEKLKAASS
ncbi:MAG: hypothetical protein JSC161_000785 [Candidatus Tokpelaia sp. JSC161]|jgi:hypothetical protein|nr:MAG: hypothetical protein JSC161_000785 [Candidatus Tokpelaia sp. JSC161]